MSSIKLNKNSNYVVKNLKGTTGLKCKCGSWIAHWRNFTGSTRVTCSVVGCSEKAIDGAHVISVDKRTDNYWWIAPFCRSHNSSKNEKQMMLKSQITLVSANKQVSCEK